MGTHECASADYCHNTKGGYRCECPYGYVISQDDPNLCEGI